MAQKKKILIYGNGNMAKTVYQFMKKDFEIVSFTVDKECIKCKSIHNIPVIPYSKIQRHFSPKDHLLLIAVGFIQMNSLRETKYLEGKKKGYTFANYIHPSIIKHKNVKIGENNIILDYASIHPYSEIGNSNFICSNTNIGHGCRIFSSCWINSGVSIAGEVTIKNNCFFGINSCVSHGVTIAEKCFIGANTLINRNTEKDSVYLSAGGEKFRMKSDSFLKFAKLF